MRFIFSLFISYLCSTILIGCIGESNRAADKSSNDKEEKELIVGSKAPDFSLADQNSKMHKLSDYKGKNVVLYFYPKDDTPGCTKEACSFRDDLSIFTDLNTVVLGVSVDNPESHKKFIEKNNLNFTLLADVEKKVTKLYNTLNIVRISKRHTFLIDKEGIIRQVYTDVDVNQHSKEITDFIKKNMM